jgi:uncharacterized protein YjbJ (UPF0337 family)
MNRDIATGKWNQLKGKVKQQWGDLTDDEFDRIAGRRDEFIGIMQEKYGKGRDEAEREFDTFSRTNQ